ncbi:AAA family ATPase [Proteiniphilum saccharofermentans]|uniref:AAA family ATPase n=1 Tax=Proteiniphilum saccharofermentans TaxID=1642647 RepID=UPI0028AD0CF1|nr:AAA family ATPase [Proteiniphilum saccharofermentans]
MIHRTISEKLIAMGAKFPIVTLTGPRQSGKSTLLKSALAGYKYVSMEDPDNRLLAIDDPRGFLRTYSDKTIIDEVQRVPGYLHWKPAIYSTRPEDCHVIYNGDRGFSTSSGEVHPWPELSNTFQ